MISNTPIRAENILELIGNTPVVKLNKIVPAAFNAEIYIKLEYFNPMSSIKDRLAFALISDAEEKGLLKEGGTVIEATSGNTGIGLALICAERGYRLIITMPESMSIQRRKILETMGAEVILTPAETGMKGAVEKAGELHNGIPGSLLSRQFSNPVNPLFHEKTTGAEIWTQMEGRIDIFIAAAGTGGTFTGVSRYLKKKNNKIKTYTVEPAESPVISGGEPSAHKIQGIGAGFIPDTLDTSMIDRIITVTGKEAENTAALLARREGIFAGISTGANVAAALKAASDYSYSPPLSVVSGVPQKQELNKSKIRIITIANDTGERYL